MSEDKANEWVHGVPPVTEDESIPIYLWDGERELIVEAQEGCGGVQVCYIGGESDEWWQAHWWYCPIPDAPPLPDEAQAMKPPPRTEVIPEGGHCTCCVPAMSCCKSIACRNRGVDMVWTPEGWATP